MIFIDTGAFLARYIERDQYHDAASEQWRKRRHPTYPTLWGQLITQFDLWFGHVMGKAQRLTERAVSAGRRWYCGRSRCADAFG